MWCQFWRQCRKMIAFYHDKDIAVLKLGGTLQNLVNICLNKSTDEKIFALTEGFKDMLQKIREDVVGSLVLFLHAKQSLMILLFESLRTIANQLLGLKLAKYSFFQRQPLPSGLHTRWDLDSETG